MITTKLRGAVGLTAMFLLLCAAHATGQVRVFVNEADFRAAAEGASKVLKFVETFEESNVGPGELASLTAPLQPGVPNLTRRRVWDSPAVSRQRTSKSTSACQATRWSL